MVCNGGGHLEEIKQLSKVWDTFDCFYVLMKNDMSKQLKEKKYLIAENSRKNNFIFLLKTIIIFFQSFHILMKEKPDFILSTGAGAAYPMLWLGKKVFHKKIVFIETFAKRKGPSRTGEKVYRFADLFIIQSEELRQFYPNAIYKGCIF